MRAGILRQVVRMAPRHAVAASLPRAPAPLVAQRTMAAAWTATSRRGYATDTIAIIDKKTLEARLQSLATHPMLFVDVREPHELVHGVFPAAVNIPLGEINAAFGLRPGEFTRKYGAAKPTPDTEIVFACKAGVRAMNAAKNVNSLGWKRTIVYSGSFQDWFGRTY